MNNHQLFIQFFKYINFGIYHILIIKATLFNQPLEILQNLQRNPLILIWYAQHKSRCTLGRGLWGNMQNEDGKFSPCTSIFNMVIWYVQQSH